MILDLKNIHMGSLVRQRIKELETDSSRICKSLQCNHEDLDKILTKKHLDSEIILKLSILLEYDFFRIYSQYLILYSPQSGVQYKHSSNNGSSLPYFRKNIYTKEVINFILQQIETGNKTKAQIIKEYNIPKTTLYKWVNKYRKPQYDEPKF